MFLTKTPKNKARAFASLATSTRRLPSPDSPLHGQRRPAPTLPENIICFQRRSGTELNRPHTGRAMHHRHVLIVPLRGNAVVCADDRELPLEPGKGLVILPYQYHHYAHADKNLHWLFITFEYAQGVVMEPLRNLTFPVDTELAGQLDTLLRAQRNLADEGLPELRLALLLAQLTPPPGRSAPASRPSATIELQVNHAAQKLRPAAPTIRELAAELGMSPSNLRTRFRASCGVSLGKHMRELRLERACGLLRMTSARISEISEQCGFSSLFSFSRTFRTRHGMSPRAYRAKAAND
ncbi:helix-turn-helix transcriptional regulator [Rariglobus hedericola]|uniref:AraC family transcriptional regulator n=1 Tax=Rariglobus hedericola TaxID=2597822 RepID=A0A556QSJ9_9BACT|nr:AraC family transcriptional regulator [Rariglobus hedericola]TSJ79611.1 AraC family transcriptional regulator [Rariglobus hedericola]